MPKIWRNRIIAGTQQFENCPEIYKTDVLILLRRDVENGLITTERFFELTLEVY